MCVRRKRSAFAVDFNHNRLQNLDRLARGRLCNDPGAFDQEHERLGAAIHDRHFGAIDFDKRVIDLAPCQGGHQMLDRADQWLAIIAAQNGAKPGIDDIIPQGFHFDNRIEIGAPENNSRVHLARQQGERNRHPGMHTRAGTMYRILQGRLGRITRYA